MLSSNQVTLLVRFEIQDDKISEAQELFRKHQLDGRSDQGNLRFEVFQTQENPHIFTSIETWQDKASIEAHDATDHHAHFLNQLSKIQSQEKAVTEVSPL